METFLIFLQIIVSLCLIILILMQSEGAGVSGVFGGSGGFYRSKKGVEKVFVFLTIFLGFLFLVLSLLQVVI
ncbi:preprotein translocase subunit SecG [Candidatus Curtissbacteria bacterium RIFCSPLOWO2_01_FULL_37_9]|uniref:Protein-export membrane protein SecG n=1 Tax=Candidatus Curtissbacteria bacterium RIFCSPLOWO2_01_FULL_37_9 TaxID=1797724 RepID=A0A1F5GV42_9BACT|nr:MAG: preprotein translocase subunit SecG [Candidatus Curtissbacteria bacterium RIFCSPLOWO2_01_FULL_37_9]